MKKSLSVFVAAIALAFTATIISCGEKDPAANNIYSGATDTVLTLSAPVVTAKAFPGVNYITWEPIAGANSFEVYRTIDGEAGSSTIVATTAGRTTDYADIAASDHKLANGKTYKYTVVAVSSSDPSRAVVVNSNQGSATVTAIVPAAGTKVDAFEDAYSKAYFEKLKNTSNLKVSTADGYVYAEYPATAGFKYTVAYLDTGVYEARGNDAITGTATTANYKDDYTAEHNINPKTPITAAGNYGVYAKIESVSNLYVPTYVKLGAVEVKSLGESSATKTTVASWIGTNKVRVTWTPAVLKATGKDTPTTNYKVYRSSDADNKWTAVSGTVIAGEKETTTGATTTVAGLYYIDDTVTDNTIGYTYYVVHTDGTLYGTFDTTGTNNKNSVTKYVYAATGKPTLTAVAYNDDYTGLKDTIKIVATKNATDYNQTLAISYVKLDEDAKAAAIVTYPANSFTTIALDNYNGKDDSYTVYIKNAKAGTYLIKVVASETGKDSNTAYKLITIDAATVATDKLSISRILNATGTDSKHIVVYDSSINDDSNALSNFKYELWSVVISKTDKYTDIVTVKTDQVGSTALTLTKAVAGQDLNTKFGVPVGVFGNATSVSYATGTLIENYFYVKKILASDATKYGQKACGPF